MGTRVCGRNLFMLLLAGVLMVSVQAPVVASTPVRTTGGVLPWDDGWPVQTDAPSAKRAGRVAFQPGLGGRGRVVSPSRITAPPPALDLPTQVTGRFVEPSGWGTDDRGRNYTDVNYWNLCTAGAVAIAASYFLPDPTQLSGAFSETYGPYSITTRWDASGTDANLGFDARGRGYIMFMAMAVQAPSMVRPGIPDYSTYPTLGGSPQGMRDALNWEISGHLGGGRWKTYFYFAEPNTGTAFTQDQLNADVVADLAGAGVPVVAVVDADYLPNWPDLAKPLHHAVAIVGYDNVQGTYSYLDTCGRQCGSLTNGGVHVITQKKLFKAIQMVGRDDADGQLIAKPDGTPKYPTGAYIW